MQAEQPTYSPSEQRTSYGPTLVAWVFLLLKLAKSGAAIKAVLAAASFGAYAWLFSPLFAAVLIAGLVIHEMGHVWAMKRVGIPTKGFYLIPFVGGAAVPERAFKSRAEEVFVAAMGPTWGIASIFIVALVMYFLEGPMEATGAAALLAFVNLFNLIPITPLDGGRITKSVALSARNPLGWFLLIPSVLAGAAALFSIGAFGFAIIIVFSILDMIHEIKSRDSKPSMGLAGASLSIAWWLGLSLIFILIVLVAAALGPGPDIALKILKDG